jgi:glucosylglycerate synthase
MNQEWNKGLTLPKEILETCSAMKPLDIMVGVLCKDVEATILNLLNVINEGLYQHFPDYKKAIVVSKGPSEDRTSEVINLFEPYSGIEKIVTQDIYEGGKGAGIRTIIELAHETDAKCLALIDGDLLSIKPVWIQTITNAILYGRADLTVPFYIRDKYDGVITNNLVYPFTRALYGLDIRQPIAGEFGLSKNLYEVLRVHPLFPPDFGVDIFIVTVAAAKEMKVKEGLYSLKIHESTSRYLEPEKLLLPMFKKVTGSMFELAKYYEDFWRYRPLTKTKTYYRHCYSKRPIPVKVDVDRLQHLFIQEYTAKKEAIMQFLPQNILSPLNVVVDQRTLLGADLWAEIVYNFTAAYKQAKDLSEKQNILDLFKTLWIGRFVSYTIETKDMDINETEILLQRQAEIFEDKLPYLRSIYP